MATPRSQRIGIWIIAIVLTIGTLGSFLIMGLSVGNQKIDQALQTKQYNDYQTATANQAKELSDKYYAEFNQYATIPTAFDVANVTELKTVDLKIGDGAEVKSNTEYNAYYIGWNPSGKIFDQSITTGSLKAPLPGGDMIPGWNEGIIGMKMGGVREITIPSEKAYGEVDHGADIPANTPLKFIVLIIPKVTEIPVPDFMKNSQY